MMIGGCAAKPAPPRLEIAGVVANAVAVQYQSTASAYQFTAASESAEVTVLREVPAHSAPAANAPAVFGPRLASATPSPSINSAAVVFLSQLSDPAAPLPRHDDARGGLRPAGEAIATTRPAGTVDTARGSSTQAVGNGNVQSTAEGGTSTTQLGNGSSGSAAAAGENKTQVVAPAEVIASDARPAQTVTLMRPGLTAHATAAPSQAPLGGQVVYTVTLENTGPLDIEELYITDRLPLQLRMTRVDGAEVVHYLPDTGELFCRVPGQLGIGKSRSVNIVTLVQPDAFPIASQP